ncbi:nuclear transport factor 2 family protein [Actinomycetes bacterium KLBMP 9797]
MTVNPDHKHAYASADQRGAVWERWVALRNGDFDQADEIVAPAVAVHVPAVDGRPHPASGKRALLSWVAAMRAVCPDGRLVTRVGPIISGDLVAGRWELIRPGRSDPVTGTDIVRVAGGRVVEFWANHDLLGAALPLGPIAA